MDFAMAIADNIGISVLSLHPSKIKEEVMEWLQDYPDIVFWGIIIFLFLAAWLFASRFH